jgi:hypothetical protein
MANVIPTNTFLSRFSVASNANKFIENFKNWKESDDEFSSIFFGKDSGYGQHKLSNNTYLMHVHTIPSKEEDRKKWKLAFERHQRITSDRALIYVKRNNDYLIIDYIANNAHSELNFSPEAKKKLDAYVAIAEKFLSREEITERYKYSFINPNRKDTQ